MKEHGSSYFAGENPVRGASQLRDSMPLSCLFLQPDNKSGKQHRRFTHLPAKRCASSMTRSCGWPDKLFHQARLSEAVVSYGFQDTLHIDRLYDAPIGGDQPRARRLLLGKHHLTMTSASAISSRTKNYLTNLASSSHRGIIFLITTFVFPSPHRKEDIISSWVYSRLSLWLAG